ncbi:MAG: hypothetical protein LLF86_01075 [Nitrospiraceae bacterium]|nr:hypothetical protein [Nitrospiraceae bacterium]
MQDDMYSNHDGRYIHSSDQLINAEKLASLGRMASGIAHELEGPLNMVLNTARKLYQQLSENNAEHSESLSLIMNEAEKCLASIRGLQDFSAKKTSGSIFLSINEVVMDTVNLIKNQPRFFSIIFDVQVDEALPAVRMDPSHLRQVIISLLMNASDAMDKHGAMKIVTRAVESEGRAFAEIEFSDSGTGIPQDDINKIFEPFFTTKHGKGTGLGLSVSYGIVKKYRGDITVSSVPNEGASFYVRLPLDSGAAEGAK